jgi:cell division protein FtsN
MSLGFVGFHCQAISLFRETAKIPGTGANRLPLSPKRQWRNPAMANNPNDPYDRNRPNDPTRTYIDDRRSPADIDTDLQPDPNMVEGPASNTRVALFAVGIAIILGAIFYGLNNTSTHQQASTVPTQTNGQKSAQTSPAPPPGTPRPNSEPGTTTGNAPANPQAPSPASNAPGGANTNTANPSNANK